MNQNKYTLENRTKRKTPRQKQLNTKQREQGRRKKCESFFIWWSVLLARRYFQFSLSQLLTQIKFNNNLSHCEYRIYIKIFTECRKKGNSQEKSTQNCRTKKVSSMNDFISAIICSPSSAHEKQYRRTIGNTCVPPTIFSIFFSNFLFSRFFSFQFGFCFCPLWRQEYYF